MIELEKISIRQYCELEDRSEYDFAIKYARLFTNAKDEYSIGDLTEMTFGFIKDLQYDIESGITFEKYIEIVQQLTKIKNIGSEPLDKFIRFTNYILESIKQIIEVENISLSHEPDADEEQAGMGLFDGLGVYLQIRSIATTFHIEPQKVREWKYSDAFVEMVTAKRLSDYERNLHKIRHRNG